MQLAHDDEEPAAHAKQLAAVQVATVECKRGTEAGKKRKRVWGGKCKANTAHTGMSYGRNVPNPDGKTSAPSPQAGSTQV
jgi:hypothetical protein